MFVPAHHRNHSYSRGTVSVNPLTGIDPTPYRTQGIISCVLGLPYIIPLTLIAIDFWWLLTTDICRFDPHEFGCAPIVLLTLPVALATLIWAGIETSSSRSRRRNKGHVPLGGQFAARCLLAAGATICFAMLVDYVVKRRLWDESGHPSAILLKVLVALLGILMCAHWVLLVWAGMRWNKSLDNVHDADNEIET